MLLIAVNPKLSPTYYALIGYIAALLTNHLQAQQHINCRTRRATARRSPTFSHGRTSVLKRTISSKAATWLHYEGAARINHVNHGGYITRMFEHLHYRWHSVMTTSSFPYTVKLTAGLDRLLPVLCCAVAREYASNVVRPQR
jgi:hypothetical protein